MEMTAQPDYLPAKEVLEILNIKPQTLYAYAARGWIRAIPQPGTHCKLYVREDVEKLRMRRQARAGHGPAAAGALRWGEPVITSSITEITPQGPKYRNRLATDLVRQGRPFEATADLLWTGLWNDQTAGWQVQPLPPGFEAQARELGRDVCAERFRGKLAMLVQSLADLQGGDPEAALGAIVPAARQILQVLAGAFGYLRDGSFIVPRPGDTVAGILVRALGLDPDGPARPALDAALTLAADHELAVPTFAARVVASTGANLNACVQAGILAFAGPLTGIGTSGIEDMVVDSHDAGELRQRFLLAHAQGRQLSGFNHPLYPQGDPRALFLLEQVRAMPELPAAARTVLELIEEAGQLGVRPGFPTGLVALQLALGLPSRSAGALFLLGRIAGFVAHVQEQRLAGFMMRPRAKFAY